MGQARFTLLLPLKKIYIFYIRTDSSFIKCELSFRGNDPWSVVHLPQGGQMLYFGESCSILVWHLFCTCV